MLSILRVLLLLALPLTAQAADEDELLRTLRSTDQTVQDLKTRALNLVNAVEEHRERYHYPDEQRVEVYVTSPARRFTLKDIAVYNDEQLLVRQEFDGRDVYAMRLGGLAPVYRGNVAEGPFTLDVEIRGTIDGEAVSHRGEMRLRKDRQPMRLELRLRDVPGRPGVAFEAREHEVRS
jgi:hypothetical protein